MRFVLLGVLVMALANCTKPTAQTYENAPTSERPIKDRAPSDGVSISGYATTGYVKGT